MPVYTNFRWVFGGESQSMAVEHGRVLWRREGGAEGAQDLGGRTLQPAFIDNHCHILPSGLHLGMLDLSGCVSHQEALDRLADGLKDWDPSRWLLAANYDQTRFPNGAHLHKSQLDGLSKAVPILIRHVNGHASVANSAALSRAGIEPDQPDFPDGKFLRGADGELTGVMTEAAHERVSAQVPIPTEDEMVHAILLAARSMEAFGIRCASDMMTGRFDLERELNAYRRASERTPVRFRLYVQWRDLFGPRAMPRERLAELCSGMAPEKCRVAGAKIFADGAIGSATAAIYGAYSGEAPSELKVSRRAKEAASFGGSDVSGQLIYTPDKLASMVATADRAGYQLAIHSIGDYATDLVMDAYDKTDDSTRHRIEHAMMLSDAQIDRMAKLGCFATFQPEFLIRFGHAYLRQLGEERRAKLKRVRSVIDAGIRVSFSSDRPIVAGDPRDGIRTATNRPEGYDPAENVTEDEALHAYTDWAAAANGDAGMGRLEAGDVADFLVGA